MSDSNVILITGCSSGFGKIAAADLAKKGHTVYATMRGVKGKNSSAAEELSKLATAENIDLRVIDLDVMDSSSVENAVQQIIDENGKIDVVVNNAGVMPVGVTEAFTEEQFRDNLDVNVLGPFRVIRAALPQMKQQKKGLLMNVSTVLGRVTIPFFGVYQASKWGLEALSETLRYELSSSGIEVVVVEPGPFATELVANSPAPADSERLEQNQSLAATLEEMMGSFQENVFQNPEAPIDPQILVDAMTEVIEKPHGQRPFRTVAGIDFGVNEINQTTDVFRTRVLENMGLASMDKVTA